MIDIMKYDPTADFFQNWRKTRHIRRSNLQTKLRDEVALRIPTGASVLEKSRFILYFLKTIEQILSLSIGAANRVRR